MKNSIPRNPVHLVQFLDNLIAGDDKHQADKPLPKEVRAELVETRDKLLAFNILVQTTKGQLRQATDGRRDYLNTAMTNADKSRATVVGLYGSKGAALVDYALVTRRKPRKAGSAEAVGVSPEESKAHRMTVHLAKMQAQREKAKARQSALDTRIAEQEAKIAKAKEATLHEAAPTSEPAPTPEPTSSSGAK